MIYRKWSLLMITPVIIGSIVSVTLFHDFYLGGNERFFSKYRHLESPSSTNLSTGKA